MVPTRFAASLLVLTASLLCGCGVGIDPAPDEGDAPVVPDHAAYALEERTDGWATEIGFEYHNRTDRTISLLNCRGGFGLHLEKREADEWVRAWEPVLLMCLSPPIEIAPGDSQRHELHVFGARPDANAAPQFLVEEIPGTYRIVITSAYWHYDHDGPPWGDEPPLGARVSAPFELGIE